MIPLIELLAIGVCECMAHDVIMWLYPIRRPIYVLIRSHMYMYIEQLQTLIIHPSRESIVIQKHYRQNGRYQKPTSMRRYEDEGNKTGS
ncbi:hypothetical protein BDV59DRAFT_47809 [Aspergillus ambiguus]|uniref:uncharacterized protein n=1 Tax=Aspergillus ambiguus TaxID=176160 RepID=UPI003CCCC6CD